MTDNNIYPRVVHLGHWCVDILMRFKGELEKDAIFSPTSYSIRLGGSVTFALVAKQLSCPVRSALFLANDIFSDLCQKTLSQANITLIPSYSTTGSSPVSIVLESDIGWRTALTISGINNDVTKENLNLDFENVLAYADIIHHGYPFLTPELGWKSIAELSKQTPNALHLVDLNGANFLNHDFTHLELSNTNLLIKGNEREWCQMTGCFNVEEACRFAVKSGVICAVATLGKGGALAVTIPNEAWLLRFYQLNNMPLENAIDTVYAKSTRCESGMVTGAGDAFLAAFSISLMQGVRLYSVNLESSLHYANDVAASWIQKKGRLI